MAKSDSTPCGCDWYEVNGRTYGHRIGCPDAIMPSQVSNAPNAEAPKFRPEEHGGLPAPAPEAPKGEECGHVLVANPAGGVRCIRCDAVNPKPAPAPEAPKVESETHGISCPKVGHGPALRGYLHAADDDSPYEVDGVWYCGRCHMWIANRECSKAQGSPMLSNPAPAPEPDPLMGIDGQKWAQEFMRIWSGRWSEVDEGLMIGWFANAIMRGFDEGQSRLRKQHGCERPLAEPKPPASPAPEPKGSEMQPRCAWEPGTTGVCEAHRSLRAEVERLKAQLASQEANHKAMLETVGAEAAAQLAEKEREIARLEKFIANRTLMTPQEIMQRDEDIRGTASFEAKELSKVLATERAARERSESVILNTAKLWSENRHYNVVREEVLAEARAILAVRVKEGEKR